MHRHAGLDPNCIFGMRRESSKWCMTGRPRARRLLWLKSDSWSATILSRCIFELPGDFCSITSTTFLHRDGENPAKWGIAIMFAQISDNSSDLAIAL